MILKNWIIVLNYNVASHTIGQIEALSSIERVGIIVVDNDSSPNDFILLSQCCQALNGSVMDNHDTVENELAASYVVEMGARLVLFRCVKNFGYSGGNNVALKILDPILGSAGQYLVINPDIIIEQATVNALFENKAELCGPAIYEHYMKSVRPFDQIDFATGFPSSGSHGEFAGPMLQGCCFKIMGSALSKYGFLPEENFLYEEEIKYFERVHRLGGSVSYLSDVRIEHIGSVSIRKRSGNYYYYILRNRLTYFTEIAGPQYKQHGRFIRLYSAWLIDILFSNIKMRNWEGLSGIFQGVWDGLHRIKGPRNTSGI